MRLLYIVFFALIFTVGVQKQAVASHAMGVDLSYTCVGPNQYLVTLSFYRDCSGITAPTSVTVQRRSASCGSAITNITLQRQSSIEVTPVCASQANNSRCKSASGTIPGVERHTYSAIITLPQQCNDWIISFGLCCRNDAANHPNLSSFDTFVYATINNTGGICNNAPSFTTLPTPYICAGNDFNFNHGAVDIDGDSLVYQVIAPLSNLTTSIPYAANHSLTQPIISSTGFTFNTSTGQMSFNPTNSNYRAVVAVLVTEYRNGVVVGTTMRDIQFTVLSPALCQNQPPQTTGLSNVAGGATIDSFTIQNCPGNIISFQIPATDPNNDTVTMTSNITSQIPGSTFSTSPGPNGSVVGNFSWLPPPNSTGTYPFQVTITDNGCPIATPQTFTYSIIVIDTVTISVSTNVFCNDSIQLEAIGGTTFSWSPPTGLSATNISNPKLKPSAPTLYTVVTECGSASVFIDTARNFSLNAGADDTICLNGISPLNPVVDMSQGPYTWSWTPTTGLSNPNVQNPVASPPVTTTYVVQATSAAGCVNTDTVQVTVSGVAPSLVVTTTPDTVCPGGIVQLQVSRAPTSCGLNTQSCTSSPTLYTVGTGSNASTSTTAYPAIYGNFFRGARHQMLYRASELQALGISGGVIQSVAFEIASISGTTSFTDFTIRIGCTNLNQITSYQPNLTTVFSPQTVTTTVGWNTYNLTNAYDWDGVSNLIVEVCFNNSSITTNSANTFTTTTFNSVVWFRADNNTVCSSTATTSSGTSRPNIRFGVCQPTLQNTTIQWSTNPPNLAQFASPAQSSTLANVFGSALMVASVVDGVCVGSAFVPVVVDTTVTVTAGPDTSLCSPAQIQLFAIPTGNPGPIPLTCGANGTPLSTTAVLHTLGSSTGVSAATSPFQGNFEDLRIQYIIRASELQAAGVPAGIIQTIRFNVSNKSSNRPFPNFTVRMGCTPLNALGNSFVPGLTTVFNPKNFTTVIGANNIVLDNPYDWDGFSNLIIEICIDANGGSFVGVDDIVTVSSTAFTSVLSALADFNNGCTLETGALGVTSGTSSLRPLFTFNVFPAPQGTFNFTWSPTAGLSNPNVQNPTVNVNQTVSYTVTISDGICVATDTVTIQFYQGYNANIFGNNVGCNGSNDGNVISVPQGGQPPYNFIWSTGQTANGVLSDTVFNLTAGSYFLTVSDANNCIQLDTFQLTMPPLLTASLSKTDISCFGANNGTISVMPSGGVPGYTFLWNSSSNPSNNLTGLTAGTYVVTITDAVGCFLVDSINIIEPAPILYQLDTTSISCFQGANGTASIQILSGGTPPFTASWTGPATISPGLTANNLSSGTYYFSLIDAGLCSVNDSFQLANPDSFIISTVALSDASCFNTNDGIGFASVNGDTTGYQFVWNTNPLLNSATAFGLPSGINNVLVTELARNCAQTANLTINAPPAITVSTVVQPITCNGSGNGQILLIVSGGTAPFDINWSNGETAIAVTEDSISNLIPGGYVFDVNDQNGCVLIDSVFLSEPDSLLIQFTKQDISCFGANDGWIKAQVSGGTGTPQLDWGNTALSGDSIFNLSSNQYTLTVTDSVGCLAIDNIEIFEPIDISYAVNVDSTTCYNGNDGSASLFVTAGGVLPVLVEWFDVNGTIGTGLNVQGLTSGLYSFILTDGNQCQKSDNFIVFQPDSFMITTSLINDASCFNTSDGAAFAHVNNDTLSYGFVWNNNPNLNTASAFGLGQGLNSVLVTNVMTSCSQTGYITIGSPPQIQLQTIVENVKCFEGNDGSASVLILSGGNPPFNYLWFDGSDQNQIFNLPAGSYGLTVTDFLGCTQTTQAVVSEPSKLEVSVANVVQPACVGAGDGSISINVSGGTPNYSYNWSGNSTVNSNFLNGLNSGIYSVEVTDANGCSDSLSVTLVDPISLSMSWSIVDETCPGTSDGGIFITPVGGTPPFQFSVNNSSFQDGGIFTRLTANSYPISIRDANNCQSDSTFTIQAPPEITVVFDTNYLKITLGESIPLVPILNPADVDSNYRYIWTPSRGLTCADCLNPTASPNAFTVYELTVLDEFGCPYPDNFITVDVENPLSLYIPNAFSPNGDGQNDRFRVYGVALGRVVMKVFNRWGELIYELDENNISGDDWGWDGTYKGKFAIPDTYVYYVEVTYLDGQQKVQKGSLSLIK